MISPGKPVPMFCNPVCEKEILDSQSNTPLVQLEAISSHPVTCYLGEKITTHHSAAFFQGVVDSKKVYPEPLFLRAEPPQLPLPLPIDLSPASLPFFGLAPGPQCLSHSEWHKNSTPWFSLMLPHSAGPHPMATSQCWWLPVTHFLWKEIATLSLRKQKPTCHVKELSVTSSAFSFVLIQNMVPRLPK